MRRLDIFSFFKHGRESVRDRVSLAVRQLEVHRRTLEVLKGRLEGRISVLFESTSRAVELKDQNRASIYAQELSELKKIVRVLVVAELALSQIVIRLETIRDIGDITVYISSAFKSVKDVGKVIHGISSSFEVVHEEIRSTLAETMVGLQCVSPAITLNVQADHVQDLLTKAEDFVMEKASELAVDIPDALRATEGRGLLEKAERTAILATGDESEDQMDEFSPILLSTPKQMDEASRKELHQVEAEGSHFMTTDDELSLKLVAKDWSKRNRSLER